MKKILHRIFFNFDDRGDPFLPYLETWKRELPDFTIMEWDRTNLPLDLNEYTRSLAAEKNHAFLSDYFRCWLLKEHGGAYLDADIEIIDGNVFRSLYEDAQTNPEYDLFIGVESAKTGGLTPHSMGVKCGASHPVLDFLLDLYEHSLSGPLHYYMKRLPIPDLVSLYFLIKEKEGLSPYSAKGLFCEVTEPIVTDRVKIYPQEYLSPLTERNRQKVIMSFTEKTCMCHHFAATWAENAQGAKEAKTLARACADGNYLVSPDCLTDFRARFPDALGKHAKRPQWKLQDRQIEKIERALNAVIPYQSWLFKLLKGMNA